MKDKKHAEMLKNIIEWYTKTFKVEGYNVEFEIEVPFNYYGDRGFVDLLVKRTLPFRDSQTGKIIREATVYDICELKTKIEDLGETIRQVKRAGEFFPKAKNLHKRDCFFKLFVLDTPENRCVIEENKKLIKISGVETEVFDPQKGFTILVSDIEKRIKEGCYDV